MITDAFRTTPEWILGDASQRSYAKTLADAGRIVLPVYDFENNTPESKAPLLLIKGGILVVPDLLVMGAKPTCWNEVKAKSVPTWRRCPPGPRWEHGIDFALSTEYAKVEEASGYVVFIVIHELTSPLSANQEGPLSGPPCLLYIALQTAIEMGDRRKDWPGGAAQPNRRGRNREGGLLWDRSAMKPMRSLEPPQPKQPELLEAIA